MPPAAGGAPRSAARARTASSSDAPRETHAFARRGSWQILALRIAHLHVVLLLDVRRAGRGARFGRKPQRPFEVVARVPIVRRDAQQSAVASLRLLDHRKRLDRAGRAMADALAQVEIAQ